MKPKPEKLQQRDRVKEKGGYWQIYGKIIFHREISDSTRYVMRREQQIQTWAPKVEMEGHT